MSVEDKPRHQAWSHASLPNPMFNFPKEPPRTFTTSDLIAILTIYKPELEMPKVFVDPKLALDILVKLYQALGRRIEKLPLPSPSDALEKGTMGGYNNRVFRTWPRALNGKQIVKRTQHGTEIPNEVQWWGASLFDLYFVQRIPRDPSHNSPMSSITISSGSKLLKTMGLFGELDAAKDEIAFSKAEPQPKLLSPWSPHRAIERMEDQIRKGLAGTSINNQPVQDGVPKNTMSMLQHDKYPDPWPLLPFSHETECLTSRINPAHLPKTLIVHDPWNLLAVDSYNVFGSTKAEHKRSWNPRHDSAQPYKLRLSRKPRSGPEHKDEEMTFDNQTNAKNTIPVFHDGPFMVEKPKVNTHSVRLRPDHSPTNRLYLREDLITLNDVTGYLICPHPSPGPISPPTFVHLDPPPSPIVSATNKAIDTAHLYLDPSRLIGEGHHSVVYRAEIELPRSVIIPPPPEFAICKLCVEEDVNRILKEEDGENGEHMEDRWKEKNGMISVVQEGRLPPTDFKMECGMVSDGFKPIFPSETTSYHKFEGQVRPIRSTAAWQNPAHPICHHLTPPPPAPPTVKMTVVVKLSNKGDSHLSTEAENYQQFPEHLFQHWSGYNVVPPMYDPVPLGPVVPQFYGFYKHNPSGPETTYFSSILLMEYCKKQVNSPSPGLTIDHRLEGISLLCRLHYAHWSHGSVYPRNILFQPGPLNVAPGERSWQKPSFRLIDFGRSEFLPCGNPRLPGTVEDTFHVEEDEIQEIFGIRLSNTLFRAPPQTAVLEKQA